MPSVKLYGQKEIRMAAYNRSASRFFLKLAEKKEEGWMYPTLSSIVFSAFTYEAFLNTLGTKIITNWDEYDRKSTVDKLKVICQKINYKPNKNKRPYYTLKKLVWFRNLTAHGREEIILVQGKTVTKQKNSAYYKAIESDWGKYCTVKNARKAFEDVEKIAEDLCQRANISKFPSFPFGSLGRSTYTIKE